MQTSAGMQLRCYFDKLKVFENIIHNFYFSLQQLNYNQHASEKDTTFLKKIKDQEMLQEQLYTQLEDDTFLGQDFGGENELSDGTFQSSSDSDETEDEVDMDLDKDKEIIDETMLVDTVHISSMLQTLNILQMLTFVFVLFKNMVKLNMQNLLRH